MAWNKLLLIHLNAFSGRLLPAAARLARGPWRGRARVAHPSGTTHRTLRAPRTIWKRASL